MVHKTVMLIKNPTTAVGTQEANSMKWNHYEETILKCMNQSSSIK